MKKILLGCSIMCLAASCTHDSFHSDTLYLHEHAGFQACGKILHARDPLHPAVQVAGLEVLLLKNGQQVPRQALVNGAFCFELLEEGQGYTFVPAAPDDGSLEALSSSDLVKVSQVYQAPFSRTLAAQVACDPDKNRDINDPDLNLIRSHTLQKAGAVDPCYSWRFYSKDARSLQQTDHVYQLHFPAVKKDLDLTIYGQKGCNS